MADLEISLVLFGGGKMGSAMLGGWLSSGLPAGSVTVVDPSPGGDIRALQQEYPFHLVPQAPDGPPPSVMVLAVKPQIMPTVCAQAAPLVGPDTLVISIAAGIQIEAISRQLHTDLVCRVMPNTPALVGRGASVCVTGPPVGADRRSIVDRLMSAVGTVAWIEDESLMDAVTAVSGSGPAYVFLLAECLARAGVAAGLSDALAGQLARQTVAGAGELLFRSADEAATLRQNVTSPGGTTAAALSVLMADDGLQPLLDAAIRAAADRSRELAE